MNAVFGTATASAGEAGPVIAIDIRLEGGAWAPLPEIQRITRSAVTAALETARPEVPASAEISLVLTDDTAVRALNAKWRGIDKSTNVMSFPQPDGPMLGDIVLACETVNEEARLAGKLVDHHMAHLIIHGFLHILGYDHGDDRQADIMESLERAALGRLGIADPYADTSAPK